MNEKPATKSSIGFTGTRDGMTEAQKTTLASLLREHSGEFHHGDCLGADAQAHDLAKAAGLEPVAHPPLISALRAYKQTNKVYEPADYLQRNREIVDETTVLFATPKEFEEQPKGGTWYTIRYAKKRGRIPVVILPDGRITQ